MATQEFHGQVGQVAGRDIINYSSRELWDVETEDLIKEWTRCRDKYRALWRQAHLNPAAFLLICALAGLAWYSIHTPDTGMLRFAMHIGSVGLAASWLSLIRTPRLKMLNFYHVRMDLIDTILQDRA